MTEKDYRCDSHDSRLLRLEESVNNMDKAQAITNERLDTISKQLENGIKLRLDVLTKSMDRILPIIEDKLRGDSAVKIAIEIAVKTSVVAGIVSIFGGICVMIFRMYFK